MATTLVNAHHHGRTLTAPQFRKLQTFSYGWTMCDIEGCTNWAHAFYADPENYGWQLCKEHEKEAGLAP